MTPRERFLTAISGGMPDRVPFVIWSNKLPSGDLGRQILARDACVVVKYPAYAVELHGIEIERQQLQGQSGREQICTVYHTPAGDLETVTEDRPGTTWNLRRPFSREEDYAPLEAIIRARKCKPGSEQFIKADRRFGDQSVARPTTLHPPLHQVMYELMGVETFSVEWLERRPRVERLLDVLEEDYRRQIAAVAASPASYCCIAGNISPQIVSPQRFLAYYMPQIERACATLHAAGKLTALHLDADNRLLAPLVAQTSVDFIESFTPPPDCDMTVTEARRTWPNKALLVNFPSSVHLQGKSQVQATTEALLREAAPGDRFALGVLEDVPSNQHILTLAETVQGKPWS
jgi:hypothetical protein